VDDVSQGDGGATPAGQGVLERLDELSDAELEAVAKRAGELLAAREKQRRADALREIERIAKEHGLSVDVKDPARKRGRPRKLKAAAEG
jgi:hypothetical protein